MNFKEMKLYPEIKKAMQEVVTSEENGREWMKIARAQMGDVKTLISAAKKINKLDFVPQQLIDFIREEIAAENNPETPTGPDGYMYGDAMTAAEEAPAKDTPDSPAADSAE